MKNLSLGALAFASAFLTSQAHAGEDPRLKVTSFNFVQSNDILLRIAEMCGKVLVPVQPNFKVNVVVDPGAHEAVYTSIPAEDGRWCLMVYTRSGRANVSLTPSSAAGQTVTTVQVEAVR